VFSHVEALRKGELALQFSLFNISFLGYDCGLFRSYMEYLQNDKVTRKFYIISVTQYNSMSW